MLLAASTLLALLLALPTPAAAQASAAPRSVVILHPSNGTKAMDLSQLAQIYKGVRRSWNSQLRISVYLPAAKSSAMSALVKGVFKLPRPEDVPTFYATAVERKLFTSAPEILSSDAAVLARVAAEPGAIGVVDAASVGGSAGVKVLEVAGL
jgi:ABC-type phosphate transport system substrate-binding protein